MYRIEGEKKVLQRLNSLWRNRDLQLVRKEDTLEVVLFCDEHGLSKIEEKASPNDLLRVSIFEELT